MLPRCQRDSNRVSKVKHLRAHLLINGARLSETLNDKEIQAINVDHWGGEGGMITNKQNKKMTAYCKGGNQL